MQIYFIMVGVVMSFITFVVHTFIGDPRVAKPLLENTNLPIASKWLNYYTWHITTIFTLLKNHKPWQKQLTQKLLLHMKSSNKKLRTFCGASL